MGLHNLKVLNLSVDDTDIVSGAKAIVEHLRDSWPKDSLQFKVSTKDEYLSDNRVKLL